MSTNQLNLNNYTPFESIKHIENGNEFWYARELQPLLGYKNWRDFNNSILRAKISFETSNGVLPDHFVGALKRIKGGKGATQEVLDYKLTRYACYLIAMNGDVRKLQISNAQKYFALQTHKMEQIEKEGKNQNRKEIRDESTESYKSYKQELNNRGIKGQVVGRVTSNGDKKLFGKNTKELKIEHNIANNRPLEDFLPPVGIVARMLGREMTIQKGQDKDLVGYKPINEIHKDHNSSIKKMLKGNDIDIEKIEMSEDIKQLPGVKKDKITESRLEDSELSIDLFTIDSIIKKTKIKQINLETNKEEFEKMINNL